ncbi:MAG: O-antigen ligase family protein [Bacteriovorax sp.]|nr:O-antigen ligase family protein [Bacteriovorax sp.]
MNFKISLNKIIDLCCTILIILIFISKISLKWTKIIPYSIQPIIFQYGLHPYINFGLQFLISLILIFIWLKQKNTILLSPIYKFYIYSLITLLFIQTMFQITLVNINNSILVQMAGLGMAILLILIYGIIIPSLFDLKRFVSLISNICVSIVVASFLCLPLFFAEMFRGGRFVGFFKHIPHMVSTSTAAFIFYFPTLMADSKLSLKNNTFIKILIIFILSLAVLLTSTKAAFGTIAITAIIGIFIFGSKKKSVRLFKISFLACLIVSFVLVGVPVSKFMYEVSTGKTSFGLRKAQDGIQTRMEEVSRGMNMFEKSPYFGLGLLYKFLNNSESGIEVEGYNSFKDPHNFFVSAAVIGGYPLLAMAILGYVLMIFGAMRGLNQDDPNRQVLGLFLLAHLPVFIIYHVHFSLGGIADRIYWLVFGYLGQQWNKKPIMMP